MIKNKTLSYVLFDFTCIDKKCGFYGIWDTTKEKFISINTSKKQPILTLKRLKGILPMTVFAKDVIVDSSEGIDMTNSGKMIKWVATCGTNNDWAIYCDFASKTFREIRSNGHKVRQKHNIIKLIPCDNEAFIRYRY